MVVSYARLWLIFCRYPCSVWYCCVFSIFIAVVSMQPSGMSAMSSIIGVSVGGVVSRIIAVGM